MPKNKSSIPQIRSKLTEMAVTHNIPQIQEIAEELVRNSPIKRASNRNRRLIPQLANNIREFAQRNPELHQRDIAQIFNVNPGRFSESINNLSE